MAIGNPSTFLSAKRCKFRFATALVRLRRCLTGPHCTIHYRMPYWIHLWNLLMGCCVTKKEPGDRVDLLDLLGLVLSRRPKQTKQTIIAHCFTGSSFCTDHVSDKQPRTQGGSNAGGSVDLLQFWQALLHAVSRRFPEQLFAIISMVSMCCGIRIAKHLEARGNE